MCTPNHRARVQAMEKGTKAFVSYVRGYKEHHCKYVFQLADLRLEQLGMMFGLLRLPVMKEVCALLASASYRRNILANHCSTLHSQQIRSLISNISGQLLR